MKKYEVEPSDFVISLMKKYGSTLCENDEVGTSDFLTNFSEKISFKSIKTFKCFLKHLNDEQNRIINKLSSQNIFTKCELLQIDEKLTKNKIQQLTLLLNLILSNNIFNFDKNYILLNDLNKIKKEDVLILKNVLKNINKIICIRNYDSSSKNQSTHYAIYTSDELLKNDKILNYDLNSLIDLRDDGEILEKTLIANIEARVKSYKVGNSANQSRHKLQMNIHDVDDVEVEIEKNVFVKFSFDNWDSLCKKLLDATEHYKVSIKSSDDDFWHDVFSMPTTALTKTINNKIEKRMKEIKIPIVTSTTSPNVQATYKIGTSSTGTGSANPVFIEPTEKKIDDKVNIPTTATTRLKTLCIDTLAFNELSDNFKRKYNHIIFSAQNKENEIHEIFTNKEGKLHNCWGPAVVYKDGNYEYWIDGERITDTEYYCNLATKTSADNLELKAILLNVKNKIIPKIVNYWQNEKKKEVKYGLDQSGFYIITVSDFDEIEENFSGFAKSYNESRRYHHGKLHSLSGPARNSHDGKVIEYFIENVQYSLEEYVEKLEVTLPHFDKETFMENMKKILSNIDEHSVLFVDYDKKIQELNQIFLDASGHIQNPLSISEKNKEIIQELKKTAINISHSNLTIDEILESLKYFEEKYFIKAKNLLNSLFEDVQKNAIYARYFLIMLEQFNKKSKNLHFLAIKMFIDRIKIFEKIKNASNDDYNRGLNEKIVSVVTNLYATEIQNIFLNELLEIEKQEPSASKTIEKQKLLIEFLINKLSSASNHKNYINKLNLIISEKDDTEIKRQTETEKKDETLKRLEKLIQELLLEHNFKIGNKMEVKEAISQSNINQTNSVKSTTTEFFEKLSDRTVLAAKRSATRKLIELTAKLIVTFLSNDKEISKNKKVKESSIEQTNKIVRRLEQNINTVYGKAIIGIFIGATLPILKQIFRKKYGNKYDKIIDEMADEFTVESMSNIMDAIAEFLEGGVVLGYDMVKNEFDNILLKEEEAAKNQQVRVNFDNDVLKEVEVPFEEKDNNNLKAI
jgi:hypothetical protein